MAGNIKDRFKDANAEKRERCFLCLLLCSVTYLPNGAANRQQGIMFVANQKCYVSVTDGSRSTCIDHRMTTGGRRGVRVTVSLP